MLTRRSYRHHDAILQYLGVQPWGPVARELAEATMRNTAQARTNLADPINAAVDALVRHRFELPALIALRRLAGTAHSTVNATQWREIGARLDERDRSALETLLWWTPRRWNHQYKIKSPRRRMTTSKWCRRTSAEWPTEYPA